jgi:hypothetical protein
VVATRPGLAWWPADRDQPLRLTGARRRSPPGRAGQRGWPCSDNDPASGAPSLGKTPSLAAAGVPARWPAGGSGVPEPGCDGRAYAAGGWGGSRPVGWPEAGAVLTLDGDLCAGRRARGGCVRRAGGGAGRAGGGAGRAAVAGYHQGESGAGKTALARRALASAGLVAWWARGDPAEADLEYGIVGQLTAGAGRAALARYPLLTGGEVRAAPAAHPPAGARPSRPAGRPRWPNRPGGCRSKDTGLSDSPPPRAGHRRRGDRTTAGPPGGLRPARPPRQGWGFPLGTRHRRPGHHSCMTNPAFRPGPTRSAAGRHPHPAGRPGRGGCRSKDTGLSDSRPGRAGLRWAADIKKGTGNERYAKPVAKAGLWACASGRCW